MRVEFQLVETVMVRCENAELQTVKDWMRVHGFIVKGELRGRAGPRNTANPIGRIVWTIVGHKGGGSVDVLDALPNKEYFQKA